MHSLLHVITQNGLSKYKLPIYDSIIIIIIITLIVAYEPEAGKETFKST